MNSFTEQSIVTDRYGYAMKFTNMSRHVIGFLFVCLCFLFLCSCNTSKVEPNYFTLREHLSARDFTTAETVLMQVPSLINGEYVRSTSVDSDDIGMSCFTYGTPLLAWFANDLEVVRWLIAHGALVDLRTYPRGDSALDVASRSGNLPVVKLLLKNGARVDFEGIQGDQRQTALMKAIMAKQFEVADFLISFGHSINSTNSLNATILDMVITEIGRARRVSWGKEADVARLEIVEAWIRANGGLTSIDLAKSWVDETREHERVRRERSEWIRGRDQVLEGRKDKGQGENPARE